MDLILFDHILKDCVVVKEDTEYLEVYNYKTGPSFIEKHRLSSDDFESFVKSEGAFNPRDRPHFGRSNNGNLPVSGLRLVMQVSSKDPKTFAGHHISLTANHYRTMMEAFHLPWRALEGTCTVGPFFWSGCSGRGPNRVFQIMARKSDVLKKGRTRGWELMLSYNFATRITSGYYKSTDSAKPKQIVPLIMAASTARTLAHPFVLPMLILSLNELSSENDDRQRQARELLRHLENAIAGRDDADIKPDHVSPEGTLIIEQINRDLYECVCKVLWKRPRAYLSMLAEVDTGIRYWWEQVCDDGRKRGKEESRRRKQDAHGEFDIAHDEVLIDLQESMLSRVTFYSVKLKGIESYAWTSMERLKVQREALYNIIAQRESKLNLEMAKSQKHIANASKRDGTTMKTLSILGAIFLPGTFLASVFSMTFFNFQDPTSPTISSDFWVYFAITIPVTVIVVIGWFVYEAYQRRQYVQQHEFVENEMKVLETNILTDMRHRTMAHRNTTLQNRPTWRQDASLGAEGMEMYGPGDREKEKQHLGFFGHSRGHSHSHSLSHSLSAHFGHNRNASQGTTGAGGGIGVAHSRSHGHLGPVSQLAAQSMTSLTPHGIHGGVHPGRSPQRSPQLTAVAALPVGLPPGTPVLLPASSVEEMAEKGVEEEEGTVMGTATGSGSGSSRDGPGTNGRVGEGDAGMGRRWFVAEKRSEGSLV